MPSWARASSGRRRRASLKKAAALDTSLRASAALPAMTEAEASWLVEGVPQRALEADLPVELRGRAQRAGRGLHGVGLHLALGVLVEAGELGDQLLERLGPVADLLVARVVVEDAIALERRARVVPGVEARRHGAEGVDDEGLALLLGPAGRGGLGGPVLGGGVAGGVGEHGLQLRHLAEVLRLALQGQPLDERPGPSASWASSAASTCFTRKAISPRASSASTFSRSSSVDCAVPCGVLESTRRASVNLFSPASWRTWANASTMACSVCAALRNPSLSTPGKVRSASSASFTAPA